MAQKDVGNKIPIYKLKKTDEVMKYYDDWGQENKYDKFKYRKLNKYKAYIRQCTNHWIY